MAFFKRSKPPAAPQRQVNTLGRTTAYSYHAQRSNQPSPIGRNLAPTGAAGLRKAKRAARYWRQRFGLLIVLITLVVAVGNLLVLDTDPVLEFAKTENSVGFVHSSSVYAQAAEKLLGSSPLNRNKITVDTTAVAAGLKKAFPELSVASVTLPFFGHRPILYLAQADPALVLTTTTDQRFIIDTEGHAIAANPVAPAESLLAVRDESGAVVRLGGPALPTTTVAFIKAIHFQLAQRQVQVDHFVLPAASSELDIYLKGVNYFIKCNLATGSAIQQAGTFLAVQQYFEGRGISPSHYVDVRVDGRAYYR